VPLLVNAVRRILRARSGCLACERSFADGVRLVSGPGVHICRNCTDEAARRFAAVPSDGARHGLCSFCRASRTVVPVKSRRAHAICNPCVEYIEFVFATSSEQAVPS
jgi:hypothetical protein